MWKPLGSNKDTLSYTVGYIHSVPIKPMIINLKLDFLCPNLKLHFKCHFLLDKPYGVTEKKDMYLWSFLAYVGLMYNCIIILYSCIFVKEYYIYVYFSHFNVGI